MLIYRLKIKFRIILRNKYLRRKFKNKRRNTVLY
jgi:hypothetical protein